MIKSRSHNLCLSIIITFCTSLSEGNDRPRIAIIGGGIGGTTTAYYLSQLIAEHGLDIHLDLYESNQVGGRLATTFVNGFEFETGGSIIHSENKYMNLFAEQFNLSKYHDPDGSSTNLVGFYDGEKFVFVQSHYEVVSIMKFWWRYGFDLTSLNHDFIEPLFSHFKRIYQLQSDKDAFEDLESFLSALDSSCPALLETSIRDVLHSKGYRDVFLKEFVFIATNVNYNQNIDIHAFVGAVALAGSQESLWSVSGGNKKVPESLLAHSDANLITKRVHTVVLMPNSKYALYVDDNAYIYDYVVIACPLIENSMNNIKFEGFPKPIDISVKYQQTVVTLVHGDLNHTHFNFDSEVNLPNQIFSINNDLFFNSLSVLHPVTPDNTYDRKVFKIFSKKQLTDEQLDMLFLKRNNVTVIEWLATPQYDTVDRNLTFVLYDNLFYINAIEFAASAMEMSAISGVNAALNILKKLEENL